MHYPGLVFLKRDKAIITSVGISENKKALPIRKYSPPTKLIPNKIAKLAPSAAPADTPNVKGLANGFLNNTCISAPAIARLSPASTAIEIRGSRIFKIMVEAVSLTIK